MEPLFIGMVSGKMAPSKWMESMLSRNAQLLLMTPTHIGSGLCNTVLRGTIAIIPCSMEMDWPAP